MLADAMIADAADFPLLAKTVDESLALVAQDNAEPGVMRRALAIPGLEEQGEVPLVNSALFAYWHLHSAVVSWRNETDSDAKSLRATHLELLINAIDDETLVFGRNRYKYADAAKQLLLDEEAEGVLSCSSCSLRRLRGMLELLDECANCSYSAGVY